jgi:hypothetical protein
MRSSPFARVGVGVLAIALAGGYVGLHYWQEWASEQRLLASSRVSVVELRTAFPPELVVEFGNTGEVPIERTHFRLTFEVDGREISRADEDVLNILPNEKRRVLLRSHSSGSSTFRVTYPVRARYVLIVLPRWLRGLPTISNDFVLGPS